MSGWTAITMHPPADLSSEAEDTANEQIEAQMNDYYGDDADGYADRTAQLPRSCDHRKYVEDAFDNVPSAGRCVIISANDTSDSGYGHAYEMRDGSCVEIAEMYGYEGARGEDVRGYIKEETGLRGYPWWEA
jgi:hypothetical protein